MNSPDTANQDHAISSPATEALVDVFIPVRNGVDYLSEAIKSVLNQTMSNFRLVVVNNNSTDGTSEVIRSFCDSRIETITHPITLPLFENFNSCLSLVRAPFFCILHADDRLLPEYLERMTSALKAVPIADLVFCQAIVINEFGCKIFDLKYAVKNIIPLSHRRLVHRHTISSSALNVLNFVVAPSILYRREILDKVGVFRTDLSFYGDLEYLQRGLCRGAQYLRVPLAIFEYRLHGKQETANVIRNLYKYRETLMYFSEEFDSKATETHGRKCFSSETAQSRVALIIVWDYMHSAGNGSAQFRSALVDYLFEVPILPKCAFLWRFLRRGVGHGRALRRTIGSFIILCVILPILSWQAAKGSTFFSHKI